MMILAPSINAMHGTFDIGGRELRSGLRRQIIGFTLVELLVTLAVVGTMVAIIIPAIGASRESARVAECTNRLKQLGVAVHGYAAQMGHIPPGVLGVGKAYKPHTLYLNEHHEYCWKNHQYTSSLGLVLPHLELQDIYDSYDRVAFDIRRSLREASAHLDNYSLLPGYLAVVRQQPEIFLCPSDSASGKSPHVFGLLQPLINGRTEGVDTLHWQLVIGSGEGLGRFGVTNYAGCGGAHSGGSYLEEPHRGFTGFFSSRNRVKLGDARDGASKTILYGETIGTTVDGERTLMGSWLLGGFARGRGDTNWRDPTDTTRLFGDRESSVFYGFGSQHVNVGFVFGDGRVEFLSRAVDRIAFYRLCGRSDQGRPFHWEESP